MHFRDVKPGIEQAVGGQDEQENYLAPSGEVSNDCTFMEFIQILGHAQMNDAKIETNCGVKNKKIFH